MSEQVFDFRRFGYDKRGKALLTLAQQCLNITGPGPTNENTGMRVEVTIQSGSVYIAIDGYNVVRIEGAETVIATARSYAK